MTTIKEEFYELYENTRRSCFFTCKVSGSVGYIPSVFLRKLKYLIGIHKHSNEFTMLLSNELFIHQWFTQWGK